MKVSWTPKSKNKKIGEIPASMTERESCPPDCPLKDNGCYADNWPLRLHWNKVPQKGLSWGDFVNVVDALPAGTLWRHNVAGDLPRRKDGGIHSRKMGALVKANKRKPVIVYTHHDTVRDSRSAKIISSANSDGFTVNLSANNPAHADELADLGIAPVVTLLPSDAPTRSFTPRGKVIIACPAEDNDSVTCKSCGVCAVASRKSIIGFRAHGSRKKKANLIASDLTPTLEDDNNATTKAA